MYTEMNTLKQLCKSLINKLEQKKTISFPVRLRQVIEDEIFTLIHPIVLTDEDLKEKALARIGAKAELLEDAQFTGSEPFKAAKAVIHQKFATEPLSGFYFQKQPRDVANSIGAYFMRSSHIDDVFETDEELERQILDIFRQFRASELH